MLIEVVIIGDGQWLDLIIHLKETPEPTLLFVLTLNWTEPESCLLLVFYLSSGRVWLVVQQFSKGKKT